jgi:hypothetical protein
VRRYLPRAYLEGFVDPDLRRAGEAAVWAHRPALGLFQKMPLEPAGPLRHFNVVEDPELLAREALEPPLEAIQADAMRVVHQAIEGRRPLAAEERRLVAAFVALLGVRLTRGYQSLDEAEAQRGVEALSGALLEMGWVFWRAEPPDYFVSAGAPFHAFAGTGGLAGGLGFQAPEAELTLPLSPAWALHATWTRRGESWRRAGERVLLELNARTLLGAARFALAPKPAIPL